MSGGTSSASRNLLQSFWHSVVGVRGAAGTSLFPDPLSTSASTGGSLSSSSSPSSSRTAANAPPTTTATMKTATTTINADATTTKMAMKYHGGGGTGYGIHRIHCGNFAHVPKHPIQEIARHKLVFLGEVHSMPPIVAFQREVQQAMMRRTSTVTDTDDDNGDDKEYNGDEQRMAITEDNPTTGGNLHVIMEHFSFEMQPLLDEYMDGKIDFDALVTKYHEVGSEDHDLQPYRGLLEDARQSNYQINNRSSENSTTMTNTQGTKDAPGGRRVQLHAGFLPRKYARMLLKEGKESTLLAASSWLPGANLADYEDKMDLNGTPFHYNVFESLLSGRSLYRNQSNNDHGKTSSDTNDDVTTHTDAPSDQFRRIFQAQVLKDEAMAHRVSDLIQKSASSSSSNKDSGENDDKFLVIAGNGHLLHYTGVPERVLRDNPEMASDTCLVISESTSADLMPSGNATNSMASFLQSRFGQAGSNPADYVFFYEIPEPMLEEEWSSDDAKEETKNAYNKVGDTASITGNQLKAAWIMHNLGYSESDFQTAGQDAYNFQGVGNPHLHANIQSGEIVLDVGSGLGIDTFIASRAAGPKGLVVGIDLSENEVMHAKKRASDRGLDNVHFVVGDMENMTKKIPDNSIDVIISNGAFCLAPNKEKAFSELFRVLKPGGRMSVCTTTVRKDDLEPGVSWPLCMKMFIAKDTLQPLCEGLGFQDVVVDDSDSSMSMEIPEEVLKQSNPARNSVHVGGEDFKHLEDFDMDAICARVCVVARKPRASTTPTSPPTSSSPSTSLPPLKTQTPSSSTVASTLVSSSAPSIMASSPTTSESTFAKIVSAAIGSTITALAVTPLEVVKVRQQSSAVPSASPVSTPSTARLPPNVSPCSKGCGTFVLSTGLGEYLTPRNKCQYFDPTTGDLTSEAKKIAETRGTFRTLRKIYLTEGLGGIYAGLAPTLIMGIPNTVMYFYLYEELMISLLHHQQQSPYSANGHNNLGLLPAVAGASARFAASLSTAPLELLRTQQAARVGAMDPTTTADGVRGGGVVGDFRTMIKSDGILSLFRGVGPTLMRDVPFSAIYWVCIETMRDFWRQQRGDGRAIPTAWEQLGQALVNGSVSGMIAAAFTTPLDVIKTRIQVRGAPSEMVAEVAASAPDGALVCNVCDNGGSQAYQVKGGSTGAAGLDGGAMVKVEAIKRPQSAFQIAKEIVETEGITGLWRGNTARMLKVAPAAAIMISSYEVGKRLLSED